MSDAAPATSTTSESTTQQSPLGNQPEVRDSSGTIKDPAAAATQPTTDTTSSTTTQKPEGSTDKDTKTETAGAPETYADFTLPEGQEINKEALASFQTVAKELNLSQEQAQRLIDLRAAEVKAATDASLEAYTNMRQDWQKQTATAKDLGDGKELRSDVAANIGRALDVLPKDVRTAFTEAMDLTGAGDHPAVLRAFNLIAQRIGEGKLVSGNPAPNGDAKPKSAAAAMFPHLPSASG